jgi:hypothetical protein
LLAQAPAGTWLSASLLDAWPGSSPGTAAASRRLVLAGLAAALRRPRRLPPCCLTTLTKAGIANMTAALAQLFAPRGIRANSVAPGPVWTPLISSTMPAEHVESFGSSSALGRQGQPAEVAPVCVMLASDEASYVSGARVAVTGGKPIL